MEQEELPEEAIMPSGEAISLSGTIMQGQPFEGIGARIPDNRGVGWRSPSQQT